MHYFEFLGDTHTYTPHTHTHPHTPTMQACIYTCIHNIICTQHEQRDGHTYTHTSKVIMWFIVAPYPIVDNLRREREGGREGERKGVCGDEGVKEWGVECEEKK